jgi:hypothetical protein
MNDGLDDIPEISPLAEWWNFILECLLLYLFFSAYVAAFVFSLYFWGWMWKTVWGA